MVFNQSIARSCGLVSIALPWSLYHGAGIPFAMLRIDGILTMIDASVCRRLPSSILFDEGVKSGIGDSMAAMINKVPVLILSNTHRRRNAC